MKPLHRRRIRFVSVRSGEVVPPVRRAYPEAGATATGGPRRIVMAKLEKATATACRALSHCKPLRHRRVRFARRFFAGCFDAMAERNVKRRDPRARGVRESPTAERAERARRRSARAFPTVSPRFASHAGSLGAVALCLRSA